MQPGFLLSRMPGSFPLKWTASYSSISSTAPMSHRISTSPTHAGTSFSNGLFAIRNDSYRGPAELYDALGMVLVQLANWKKGWANDLHPRLFDLENVAFSLIKECEHLQAFQRAEESRLHHRQGIWEVIRKVVRRCLDETANPLQGDLHRSLTSIGTHPSTMPGFLHLLDGYEDVKNKLHHHLQVLCLLRTSLGLEQRMFEAEDAREKAKSKASDQAQDTLRAADYAAYEAAKDLRAKIDQLSYNATQIEPILEEAIKQVEEVHGLWRSKSKNVHFLTRAPANSYYIGQKEQLDEIRKAFEQSATAQPEQKRFVIQGLPGSGKTEMALKYAAEQKWQFWGVFWIDASSKANATSCFIEIAKVFGESETEQAAKQHLGTRHPMYPWLLIIDNADDDNILLEDLVPPGDTGYVLVTTRNPEKISFGTAGRKGHIKLSAMREADATELLLTASKYKEKALKDEEVMNQAKGVCLQLHYLPLALVHAGKAIRHFFLDMKEYMRHFNREAETIRQHWRQNNSNSNDKPYDLIKSREMDEDDRLSVFASFEVLTLNHLKEASQNDVQFEDAIELLQVFSFLHFQNIRVDFLIQAALNPMLENTERAENERIEGETLRRLGLQTKVSWAQSFQQKAQAALSLASLPAVLPDALKNPRNLDEGDLKGQVERRVRSALRILASRSLIMRATRDDKMIRNNGTTGSASGHDADDNSSDEMDDHYVDTYTMHPLVHQWVRERPSLSVSKQALFCQCALTILSNSVRLVGGNSDSDMAFRRALKPHIIKASEFSSAIEERISRYRKRVERDWWLNRLARWATHLCSGPWQAQMRMGQLARFGRVFLECGDYKKAEELLTEVHGYLVQRLGPDHPLAHLAKLGLAKALLFQTRRKESTELLRAVYSSRLKTLGPKHPQTLDITTELAESVLALGRITESFELCKQALVGLQAAYGEEHKKTIHCIDLIGNVHFFYNDYEQCLFQHQKALELTRKMEERRKTDERRKMAERGDGVPELEMLIYEEHLAAALMFVGRETPELRGKYLAEADQLSKHVVERRQQILGRHHPYTLYGQAQRGRIRAERWRDDPAELAEVARIMRKTLEVARRDLGDGHLGVLAGKKWFAEVLMLQGALGEAERLLREATDKRQYAKASDIDGEHPDRIIHVWQLVLCLERMGRNREALELCRELKVNIPRVGGHGLGSKHRFNARLEKKTVELEGKLQDAVEWKAKGLAGGSAQL